MDLQVKVRRRGSDTKYMAKVLAVGAECDIGEACGLPHQKRSLLVQIRALRQSLTFMSSDCQASSLQAVIARISGLSE